MPAFIHSIFNSLLPVHPFHLKAVEDRSKAAITDQCTLGWSRPMLLRWMCLRLGHNRTAVGRVTSPVDCVTYQSICLSARNSTDLFCDFMLWSAKDSFSCMEGCTNIVLFFLLLSASICQMLPRWQCQRAPLLIGVYPAQWLHSSATEAATQLKLGTEKP